MVRFGTILLLKNCFMSSCLEGAECRNVCGGQDTGAVDAGHHVYGSAAWKLQTYYVCRAESGNTAYAGYHIPPYQAGACVTWFSGSYHHMTNKECLCRIRGKHVSLGDLNSNRRLNKRV